MELNEQEVIRRENLEKLREMGINPYPAAEFKINATTSDIKQGFNKDEVKHVTIAGRIMSRRMMGKAAFVELQDPYGRIQLYISRDDICTGENKDLYNIIFKKLLDLGDIIGVDGYVFSTKTGEISIHVKQLQILSKSLRPLPVVKHKEGVAYDAFLDPEQRYRQRYVDLIVNQGVKEVFLKRTKIFQSMRQFFITKGYVEVDTPVLQSIPGGASARPFVSHHEALNIPLYLRIANELYLKRLIVGGFDGVFEFSRNFRNEGMDRTHNPEFTVMEIYVPYKDYNWMMVFTEQLLERICLEVLGTTEVLVGDTVIDFKAPYRRVTMAGAIQENTGVDISNMTEEELRRTCIALDIDQDESMGKGKLIDEIFGKTSEKKYVQPTFIIDYPIAMSPLCKSHRNDATLTERFELIVNGVELCNAYSELNDPIEQRLRFEEQLQLQKKGDDEAMYIDQDFLRALEYGMPPTSGMGIGMDRLTMLLTGQTTIQEVLLFPQMRPEVSCKP